MTTAPETMQAIVAAGRHYLGTASEPFALASPDVAVLARRHGMTFFVHRAAMLGPGAPSPELDACMRRQTAVALGAAASLAQVLDALERGGIGAVAIKGPALAAWLYGNVAAREFADIDIAVARGDRLRALEVLEQAGYRLPHGMPRDIAALLYDPFGSWPLEHIEGGRLDLHWHLGYPRFAAPLSGAEVVADRVPIDVAGRRVAFVSPTHAAVIAVSHAAKHLWTHLEALLGIAALAQRADVGWAAVEARLRRARGWTAAVVGLRLASTLFAVEAPIAIAPAPTRREQRLLDLAASLLSAEGGDHYARWNERRAHRDALDTMMARAHYDFARVFAPTPAEWVWRPLPATLAPAYYVLRLARLAVSGGHLAG